MKKALVILLTGAIMAMSVACGSTNSSNTASAPKEEAAQEEKKEEAAVESEVVEETANAEMNVPEDPMTYEEYALGELYFAFYDVTRIYEEDIPERIGNLRSQICATDKTMRVSDSLYEYYKDLNDVSDRQVLYKILGNRLIIALKQDDKPYAFNIKSQNKYKMGRYYYEHCKDKSTGFSYTIPGFVEVPEHVDKLRDYALEGVKIIDKEEEVER